MKHSKRFQNLVKTVDPEAALPLADAIKKVKESANAKFTETVEIAVNLGVNPKHADQQVRGTVVLPHGTGRTVRVLVFAQGEKVKEAEDAGADHVGG